MNIVLDTIISKTMYHDEVSNNFHFAMEDLKSMLNSVVETLNIHYHLLKQDEKDRESIYLMGVTENTQAIDYQNDGENPPITLDKN